MTEDRTDQARRRLLDLRRGAGAWGYHPRSSPAVEPSALAGLALLAGENDRDAGSIAAARWLASTRRPDGSTGVTDALPEPGWSTPFALLLWGAVGGFEAERSAAVDWLLKREGRTYRRAEDDPLGHDTSIVGWPWVEGTHSWVEPTGLALLGLGREGRGDHPRAVEGARLLVDRAIPGGGWNLGNPVVFGTPLRPLPGPSGLALLALAAVGVRTGFSVSPLPPGEAPGVRDFAPPAARKIGPNENHSTGDGPLPEVLRRGAPSVAFRPPTQPSPARGEGFNLAPSPLAGEGWGGGSDRVGQGSRRSISEGGRSRVIAPAIAYLRKALAETLAPISLGWGLLGLRAWRAEPSESSQWLASAFDRVARREARPDELAMLLLAASPRSLDILGIVDRAEGSRHA